MKKLKFKTQIIVTSLSLLFLAGCYEFDFVNQPYQADHNSSFDVEISINLSWGTQDDTEGYFGVLLPIGWTISDTVEYVSFTTNVAGEIIYSDDLVQQMNYIDPPPMNYYWWVGLEDNLSIQQSDTIILNVEIFTDSQTGTFFLDYMLGDNSGPDYYGGDHGLNYRRSNNHLIIVGDPVGCHPEGITLSSQAEIDSFQYNYPDCSEIAGNLYISGDDITNLSGLDIVNAIGGNFSIVANDSLSNITGLNNLTSVGGVFWITSNPSLTDLVGLENINSIGRDLKIESNFVLFSLSSLSGLETLGRDLKIYHNIQLTNLAGLENITSVEGSLIVIHNINLNNLESLSNITSTGGDLTISANRSLLDLTGLSNIDSVGGSLQIIYCDSLSDFSGLDNVSAIGCDLIIYGNSNLENLSGLENLDTIGRDIQIGKSFPRPGGPVGNPILTNILALENLFYIGRDVNINFNYSLTNCEAEGICNYLGAPNGVVNIYGNDTGCDKPTEVAEACGITLPCLPFGPYYFNTQVDIDSFQVNYPDCNQLEGNVSIGGSDITNLNGLYGVTSVGDNLSITASNLSNINGLSLLTTIGGNLRIYGPEITSLNPLSLVTSIGGYLRISDTDITDLNCFSSINSIDGDIWLDDNHYLNSLTGLQNIEPASIDNLFICGNYSLSDCDVESICNYLAAPNGTVTIENNGIGCNSHMEVVMACESHCLPEGITFSTQTQIDSFQINYPGCTEIEGDVTISGNDVNNLNGLISISTIGGTLFIHSNLSLVSLSGLDNLTSIEGGLHIGHDFPPGGNYSLSSLSGLNNLNAIGNDLEIVANTSLTSISALSNLTSLGGSLIIGSDMENVSSNGLLTNLSGLEGLTTIAEGVSISSNGFLTSLVGLNNITEINGSLNLVSNPLTDLSGLGNLETIAGRLAIINHDSLISLTGLINVTQISDNFIILDNASLQNLSGIEYLTQINGTLSIKENDSLTNIMALENLDPESIIDLKIRDNSSLSTCEVQSICEYLAAPNGIVEIHDNAPGCNSQQEVQAECDSITSIESSIVEKSFTISPNPNSGIVNIRFKINEHDLVILDLYEISGVNAIPLVNEQKLPGSYELEIDVNDIPAGVYFCVLKTNKGTQTRKIIKL